MKTITYNPETHVLVPRDLIADAKQIFEPNTNGDCIDVIEWFAAMMAVAPQPEPNPNRRAGCSPDNCSCCGAEPHEPIWRDAIDEIEALRAEVERLSRYYKNGIDCFADPCERHSGERTPPFAEFFEKYGGQCLICVVDNNKALQAENARLAEALRELEGCEQRDEALLRQALDALKGMEKRASSIYDGYPPSTASIAAAPYREVARAAIAALRERLGEKA